MDPLVEDTVVRLAVSRGLVMESALDEARAGPEPVVDTLVRSGRLDASTVPMLRQEALRALLPPPGGWPVRDWDRYRFLELVGEGATGRVYKALDLGLPRLVALKFLQGSDPELLERFRREAQALAQMDHPGICGVLEVGTVDGLHYIAMQFAHGEPLGRAAQRMTLERKLKVIREVAEALHEAHRAGFIHRDVKPGNIMVEHRADGTWRPLVVDFGLARQTAAPGRSVSGAVMGTPRYMSPEQARGRIHGLDRRTDVYGLGATLYSVLTDAPPFDAPSLPEVLRKVVDDVPLAPRTIRPEIPRDVESIVMKCLRKNPEERYGSARELAEDLGRYLDGEPITARRTARVYRVRMAIARNRREAATAAVALLLLAATAGWGLEHKWRSAQARRLAQRFGQQVEHVEALARHSALVPLHDTRPDRERIRAHMEAIERAAARAGDLGRSPGSYALGRGYLALGDWSRALDELQRAWDAGYRDPEAEWSVALALGQRCRHELGEADRIEDPESRTRERERLEAEYRPRILAHLRRSAGVQVEAPEYVEALLARYEGRLDEAVEKAGAAADGRPWFYEAKQLEGEIRAVIAEETADRGELGEADAEFRRAEKALRDAIAVGSSDPATYLALASLEQRLMVVEIGNRGNDVEPYFVRGKEAVERALTALPDDPDALVLLADLHRRLGEHLMNRGDDPTDQLGLAVAAAESSLVIRPGSAGAFSQIGSAFRLLAKHQQGTGQDPRASYARSAAAYEQARAIDPASVSLSHLGLLHKSRGLWLMSRGDDPRPSLKQAVSAYEAALRRSSGDVGALNNLGNAWLSIADYEESIGMDAVVSLTRAGEAFRAGLEVNPDHAVLLYGLGYSLNRQAGRILEHGYDPCATLDEALNAYERGIAVNPRSTYLAFLRDGCGYAHLLRARFELSRGIDPGNSFLRAEEAFRLALDANPNHIYSCQSLADVMIRRAELALDRGEDPGALLDEAVRCAKRALRINPTAAAPELWLAEAARVRGRVLLERGADPGEALGAGAAAARRALDVNPTFAEALVVLGRLAVMEARWEAEHGRDPAPSLVSAHDWLEEAVRLRPGDVTARLGQLELCAVAARRRHHAGEPAQAEIAEGLRAADAALSVWESHAEVLALRGRLLLVRAAQETEPGRRAAILRRADQAMSAALERNTHLRRRYAADATAIREALAGV